MADAAHFLGIDLGTSGCRAVVIDQQDRLIATADTVIKPPLRHHQSVEQDPLLWWRAVGRTLDALARQTPLANVQALAVDGTSGTLLLADAAGRPIGPALMYNDARAVDQARRITAVAAPDAMVHGATSTLAKLLWLHDRGLTAKAQFALHQADWIAARFTGRPGVSDDNNALKLGFDSLQRGWPDWFDRLELPRHLLPQVQSPGSLISPVSAAIAARFGFAPDTRVVAGTTDSTAAFIAAGASARGEAVTSLGSTIVLKVIAERPVSAPPYGIYSQPFFGRWLAGGASNSGGAVLLQHFTREKLKRLTPLLDPDQPTGLDYYPLPAPGERFPFNDAELKPRMTPRPERDQRFFQALLEGMARIEHAGYRRLAEFGAPYPVSVRSVGGGAANPAWTELRRRELGVPMLPAQHGDAAFGAAKLARFGVTGSLHQEGA